MHGFGPRHDARRLQIGDDLGPGAGAAERYDAVLQRLLQHQREEAAEHVAADGLDGANTGQRSEGSGLYGEMQPQQYSCRRGALPKP